MNKWIVLGLAATFGAANVVIRTVQGTPVELQPASPGTVQTGNLNISGTANVGLLKSQGTVFGQSTAPTGFAYGGFFTAASNQARGFYGYASSPTGLTYGGFFQNASNSGRAVYGLATATNGFTYGGYFQSASPDGRALIGVAASSTGTSYGVYGKAVSSAGYGVFSDGRFAATGQATFSDKVGIGTMSPQAALNVNGTSWFQGDTTPLSPAAGKGIGLGFSGELGYVFGFDYASFAPKSLVLQGPGGLVGIGVGPSVARLHVAGGGLNAVYGSSSVGAGLIGSSTTGTGVRGSSTSGFGVHATTNSHIAVYARSEDQAGLLAEGAYIGAQGTSFGSDANRQAVRGDNAGSATGYAGLFIGNTWVVGTLSKSAGAFHIDHPLDPKNKYLSHSFVESPDMKNIYDGIVVTDEQGSALVLLPDWFGALNRDFRYQLTVVGKFAQAIVAKEIENNQFVIRTNEPNVKVCWQVTGIRHDPYAEKNRIQVEVDKPAEFRGKYIYPEGYGENQSMSIAGSMGAALPTVGAKKGARRSSPPPNRR